ncbi:hypothetical protein DASC09_024830 [Saccharomycopsis crataegensis]|uniref:Uncharacterized protein n=1 Tax=Saccharomycopsis crataegensis TaxID=43959 RepID=A0AAV5QLW2_9ASCO|nr:hypothetical protein DASC09_024830 [Saccharomycopsis crataegensis]
MSTYEHDLLGRKETNTMIEGSIDGDDGSSLQQEQIKSQKVISAVAKQDGFDDDTRCWAVSEGEDYLNHCKLSDQNNRFQDLELQNPPEQNSKSNFDIPDGGYGWVVVGAVCCINACSWGAIAGFSVILAYYMQHSVFEDGSKMAYSVISGLSFGAGLIFSPLVIYLAGISNANIVVFSGGACQFISLFCASYATKIYQIYLTQGLLSGLALSLIGSYTPSIPPQWFVKRRSFAMGLTTCGAGMGALLFNLTMQRIIDIKSVQWALRTEAIIIFSLVSISAALLRTRTQVINPQLKFWDGTVAKTFPFWMHIVYNFTAILSFVTVQYVIADATRSLGYSADQGADTSALMATGVIIGRPLLGFISDRLGAVTVGIWTYAVCALFTLAMWMPGRNLATIYAYSLIIGGLMGFNWGANGAIIPRITGLKRAPATFGMTWVFIGIAGIVSPIIGLGLKRSNSEHHQYEYVALFAGISFATTATALFFLRGYLVARDSLVLEDENLKDGDRDNDNELHVNVPWKSSLEKMFTLKSPLKV